MNDPPEPAFSRAPRAMLLLPVAVAAHVAEEWYGGFPEWARANLGMGLDEGRFVAINSAGIVLFAGGAIVAYSEPRAAWFGVALTALICVNAFLHAGTSLAFGGYSPGTITGVLLYLPLSFIIFRWAAAHLSRAVLVRAIAVGIGIHAMATLTAMS